MIVDFFLRVIAGWMKLGARTVYYLWPSSLTEGFLSVVDFAAPVLTLVGGWVPLNTLYTILNLMMLMACWLRAVRLWRRLKRMIPFRWVVWGAGT